MLSNEKLATHIRRFIDRATAVGRNTYLMADLLGLVLSAICAVLVFLRNAPGVPTKPSPLAVLLLELGLACGICVFPLLAALLWQMDDSSPSPSPKPPSDFQRFEVFWLAQAFAVVFVAVHLLVDFSVLFAFGLPSFYKFGEPRILWELFVLGFGGTILVGAVVLLSAELLLHPKRSQT